MIPEGVQGAARVSFLEDLGRIWRSFQGCFFNTLHEIIENVLRSDLRQFASRKDPREAARL